MRTGSRGGPAWPRCPPRCLDLVTVCSLTRFTCDASKEQACEVWVWVTLSTHWVLPWGSRGQQMASNCLKEEAPHQLGGPTQERPHPHPKSQ